MTRKFWIELFPSNPTFLMCEFPQPAFSCFENLTIARVSIHFSQTSINSISLNFRPSSKIFLIQVATAAVVRRENLFVPTLITTRSC